MISNSSYQLKQDDLLKATELEDGATIERILSSTKKDFHSVDLCFEVAVAKRHLGLVKLLLTGNPRVSLVDELFRAQASVGIHPELIYILQRAASPRAAAEQHRVHDDIKRQGLFRNSSHYVVSLTEPQRIHEFQLMIEKFQRRTCSSNRKLKFDVTMQTQSWVNSALVDAVICNHKLFITELLSVRCSIHPSQLILQEALIVALRKGNLSIAVMLVAHEIDRISINSDGFTEALAILADDENVAAVEWMLNGRQGHVPHAETIDACYTDHALRCSEHAARAVRLEQQRRIDIERRVVGARRLFNGIEPEIHSYSHTHIESATSTSSAPSSSASAATEAADPDRMMGPGGGWPVGPREGQAIGAVEADELGALGRNRGRNRGNPGAGNGPQAQRSTLNQAVWDCIERRLATAPAAPLPTLSDAVVNERLFELIEATFETTARQEAAFSTLQRVTSSEAVRMMGLTLQFLSLLPSAAQMATMWMTGFLGESVAMHSCNPGVLERIVTGLRGIDDPELGAIFRQAEGPALARIFLTGTFNIFFAEGNEAETKRAGSNAKGLAEELLRRGIRCGAGPEEVAAALTRYAMESIEGFGVNPQEHAGMVESIVDAVVDGYETFLEPHVGAGRWY